MCYATVLSPNPPKVLLAHLSDPETLKLQTLKADLPVCLVKHYSAVPVIHPKIYLHTCQTLKHTVGTTATVSEG